MKAFYAIFLLVFLASCGTDVAVETTTPTQTVTEQTTQELDLEATQIPEEIVEEDVVESKVVKLDAPYKNPQTTVDMEIEYTLNANEEIETIEVSATTFDISGFNDAVQKVVGMTLEEASDTYVS
jgi:hypothetical protein